MTINSSYWSTFLHLLMNYSLFLFFILGTCKSRFKHKLIIVVPIISSYVGVAIGMLMLFVVNNAPFPQFRYTVMILWIAYSIFMGLFLLESSLPQITFLVFSILNIQLNSGRFAEIIFNFDFFPHWIKSDEIRFFVISFCIALLLVPVIWYLFFGLYKKIFTINFDKSYWKYLFFVPVSAYFYGVFSFTEYGDCSNISLAKSLVALIALNALTFLSYLAILHMLIKTNASLLATQKAANIEQLLLIKSEQYKKLTDNITQTDRLHHDIRHHFITLKGYIENKDFAGASDYLFSYIGKELPKEVTPLCENQSIDMILRYYIAIAKEHDVQVNTSLQLPDNIKMSDVNLCVLFGNLVENAVNACKNQTSGTKFITIKAKTFHQDMLAITIANSFSGEITRNDDGFVSTKHAGMGIGTSSVMDIVSQNGGNCKFTVEENIFKVSILLSLV